MSKGKVTEMLSRTDTLLTEWAKWIRSGKPYRGHVSAMAITMREATGDKSVSAYITDDWALLIDKTIARLKLKAEDLGLAVELYYSKNLDYRELGRILGVSKDQASKLVSTGVAWIDGVLTSANDE